MVWVAKLFLPHSAPAGGRYEEGGIAKAAARLHSHKGNHRARPALATTRFLTTLTPARTGSQGRRACPIDAFGSPRRVSTRSRLVQSMLTLFIPSPLHPHSTTTKQQQAPRAVAPQTHTESQPCGRLRQLAVSSSDSSSTKPPASSPVPPPPPPSSSSHPHASNPPPRAASTTSLRRPTTT